jgi:hypothetical protein
MIRPNCVYADTLIHEEFEQLATNSEEIHSPHYTQRTSHAKNVLDSIFRAHDTQTLLCRIYTHHFDQGYGWDTDIIGVCDAQLIERYHTRPEFFVPFKHTFIREVSEYRQDVFGIAKKTHPFIGNFMYVLPTDRDCVTIPLKKSPIILYDMPQKTAQLLDCLAQKYTNPVIEIISKSQRYYPLTHLIGNEHTAQDTALQKVTTALDLYEKIPETKYK